MSENAATASAPDSDSSTDSSNTDSDAVEVEETFASFPLDKKIQAAVTSLGFVTPTPIQIASMKPLLAGKDVIGGARTGSGKTAAFGLPLLENVKDGAGKAPRGLILAPTRELAMQVTEALKTFAKNLPVKITTIYGGAPYDAQLRALRNGVTIVVGTPGRVIDHMNRKSLDLSKIEFLVLDEADEMLRMGFIEPVEEVLAQLPEKRQIALFSATMPPPIQRVAEKYLKNPVNIQVEDSGGLHVDHIEQRAIVVAHRDKIDALVRVLGSEPRGTTLIFARTRAGCAEVADELSRRGISADALHGDLNQAARERVLARMRAGRLDIVVATDVAARGIDVESITHVVNLQLPDDAEIYVHRIGRTGRAGRKGIAISFVTDRERHRLKQFQRTLGVQIDGMRVPSDAEIIGSQKTRVVDGVKSDIERELPTLTGAMRWWDEWMSTNREVYDAGLADSRDGSDDADDADGAVDADAEATDAPEGASEALEAFDELAAARTLGAALLARLAAGEGIDLSRPPSDRPPHYARDRGPARDDRPGPGGQRPQRPERAERAERPPRGSYEEVELYIPVGKSSGVSPGDIVGALANEAGIPGGLIGRITMLPAKTLVRVEAQHAQRVVRDHAEIELRGNTVTMSVSGGGGGDGSRPQQHDRDDRGPRKRPHGAREPREHTAHSRGPRPARAESDRADRSARSRSPLGEPGPHGARPPREDAARPSRSGPPPSTRPVRVPAPAQGKPKGKPTPGKAAASKAAASRPPANPGKSSAGKTTSGHGGKKPAASGPKSAGTKGRPGPGKPASGPPGGMKPPRRKSKQTK